MHFGANFNGFKVNVFAFLLPSKLKVADENTHISDTVKYVEMFAM